MRGEENNRGVLTYYFQSVIIIDKPTPSNSYEERLIMNQKETLSRKVNFQLKVLYFSFII